MIGRPLRWTGWRVQAALLRRTAGLALAAAPRWAMAAALLTLLQALLPAGTALLVRDAARRFLRDGAFWQAAIPVACALLAGQVLSSAARWVHAVLADRLERHVYSLVHAQSCRVDLACFDTPAFHDRLYRARMEAPARVPALLASAGSVIESLLAIAALAAIFARYGAWPLFGLGAVCVPAVWLSLRRQVEEREWRRATTENARRASYFDWLLAGRDAAATIRLYDLGGPIEAAFAALRRETGAQRERLARRHAAAEVAAAAMGMAAAGLLALGFLHRAGAIPVPDLILLAQASFAAFALAGGLSAALGAAYAHSLVAEELFEFLSLRPLVTAASAAVPVPVPARSIRVRGVTFRYPGAEHPALHGLDLEIPAGRITAITGWNGAGKSTLLKLLCRLYDPTAGAIELDGVDLRDISPEAIRARIAAVLQPPLLLEDSVAANVTLCLGGHEASPAVQDACRRAGAAALIGQLPGGYAQQVGAGFAGGMELSSGERQKIALARALYRDSPILLLDEPTAHMDPVSESRWLAGLRRAAAGKTVVLVTHRAAGVRIADLVYVMENGRLAASQAAGLAC